MKLVIDKNKSPAESALESVGSFLVENKIFAVVITTDGHLNYFKTVGAGKGQALDMLNKMRADLLKMLSEESK